jgi:hypothetical protein
MLAVDMQRVRQMQLEEYVRVRRCHMPQTNGVTSGYGIPIVP